MIEFIIPPDAPHGGVFLKSCQILTKGIAEIQRDLTATRAQLEELLEHEHLCVRNAAWEILKKAGLLDDSAKASFDVAA